MVLPIHTTKVNQTEMLACWKTK